MHAMIYTVERGWKAALAALLAIGSISCGFEVDMDGELEPRFVQVADESDELPPPVAVEVASYLAYETDAYPASMAPLAESEIVVVPDQVAYTTATAGTCTSSGSCFWSNGLKVQKCTCRGCSSIYALCGDCESFQCDK